MPSTVQWNKMKKFFLLPPKHPGIPGTEENLFKAYEEAETNHEKLEIVFHLPIVQDLFRNQEWDADQKLGGEANGGKNDNDSKRWRELGNQAFKAGNDRKALQLYNEAVIYAIQHKVSYADTCENGVRPTQKTLAKEPSSNHFVLALANRSAAHVRLKQWKHAATDLSMILGNLDVYRKTKNDGSKVLQHELLYPYGRHATPAKLWERLYSCLVELQKYDDAKVSLAICIEALKDQRKLEKESGKKDTCSGKIQEFENKLKTFDSSLNVNQGNCCVDQTIENTRLKSFVSQSAYPALSNAIDIKDEPNRGRFGVANRNINVGEVLIEEEPVAAKIKQSDNKYHCGNCLRECWGHQVACSKCIVERFCSNDCLEIAQKSYHPFDCGGGTLDKGVATQSAAFLEKMLTDLQGETGAIGFHKICYRIVAQKPLGYFKKHFSWILDAKDESKPTVNEIFTPGSYESLSTLVRHTQNDTSHSIFWLLVSCSFHMRTLQLSGYFDAPSSDGETFDIPLISIENNSKRHRRSAREQFTEDEKLISAVLIYVFQLLRYNMHAILAQDVSGDSPNNWNKWISKSMGTAIYPTLALLNHSCDPNITKYFDGKKVIVVAGKKIFKGEEVTENYFPFYPFIAKEDRQKFLLKHYCFECTCVACVCDYPMKEFIPSILELQPSRFGLKKGVKTPEDMKNALTKLSISISVSKEEILSDGGDKELNDGYEVLVEAYGKMCSLISQLPHQLIFDNYEWHGLLLRRLYGNRVMKWN